ncbi:MAG: hypothetical protein MJK14_01960 [Rivularia sp. ALOHA_DT_140]|nr:hypothetical protein [Rivularia sp. ALOHA_DT_140]
MKRIKYVLQFTSVIVGAILLNLPLALANKITVDNSINSRTSFDFSDSNHVRNIINTEENTSFKINLEHQHPSVDINDLTQEYSQNQIYLDEITDVNKLQDISPGHWAYQALRNLVEKYRCIRVSQNQFNCKRAMTRYEFALSLNNCLLRLLKLNFSITQSLTE